MDRRARKAADVLQLGADWRSSAEGLAQPRQSVGAGGVPGLHDGAARVRRLGGVPGRGLGGGKPAAHVGLGHAVQEAVELLAAAFHLLGRVVADALDGLAIDGRAFAETAGLALQAVGDLHDLAAGVITERLGVLDRVLSALDEACDDPS